MVWKRGTAAGALAGVSIGFLAWLYTTVVPAVAEAGWIPQGLLAGGPFDVAALSPVALFGSRLDPLTHAAVWSLGPNLLAYVLVSLLSVPDRAERQQAERFVTLRTSPLEHERPARAASFGDLHRLASALRRPRAHRGGARAPRQARRASRAASPSRRSTPPSA